MSLNLLHCVSKGGVPLSSDRSQLNIISQEMLLDYVLSPLGFGVGWHQELRFLGIWGRVAPRALIFFGHIHDIWTFIYKILLALQFL